MMKYWGVNYLSLWERSKSAQTISGEGENPDPAPSPASLRSATSPRGRGIRVLFYVLLLILSLPLTAEAQRSYTKPGDGGIEDKTSPDYVPIDKRVNGVECAALRATSNLDAKGNRKGYISDIVSTGNLMNKGGMICPCAPQPGLWLERFVYCFADAPDGLLYNIIQDLIARASYYYWQFYLPLIMLSVALFGWKMATGQLRSLTKDTFLFAVKLASVVTFLAMFPVIHAMVLRMVQFLAGLPADALAGFSDICNLGPGAKKPNLWAQWDCVFGKLVGISSADPNGGTVGNGLFMGILGYLMSYLFLPGYGAAIVITGVSAIFMLIGAALRAVNTYFMAVIAVSFLLLMAPLFIPLILFGATHHRFMTWLQLLIGYMLQPMMLIMFMGIMMVALQYAIFQGPASLFGALSNTNPSNAKFFAEEFAGDAGPGVDITKNFQKETILKSNLAVNPEKAISKTGKANSLQYGTKAGDIGVVPNMPVAPSGVDSGRDNLQGGVEVNGVNPKLADDLSKRPGAVDKSLSFGEYLEKVTLQLLTTAMLVYTLYSIFGSVPDITHGLVGGSTANLASAKMVGQAQAERGTSIAKQLVKTAIDIKTGGLTSGAAGGSATEILKNAAQNLTGKR